MSESGDRDEPTICRLCLSTTTTCLSLVEDFEALTMLESLTALKITSNDEISTVMCSVCDSDLRVAFNIQQRFLKSAKRFHEQQVLEVMEDDNNVVSEIIFLEKEAGAEVEVDGLADDECVESEDVELDTMEEVVCESSRTSTEKELPCEETVCENLDNSNKAELVCEETVCESPAISTKEEFVCDICGAVRASKGYLKLHKYRCHKRVGCAVCGKVMSAAKIKHHMEVHKNKGEVKDEALSPETFPCVTCGKVKFSRLALARHVSGMHTTRKCPVCNKHVLRSSLGRHVAMHQSKLPTSEKYNCDLCDKVKHSKDALSKHKFYTHTKKTCPVCQKECTAGSIRNHLRLHQPVAETEKKSDQVFECDICGDVKPTRVSLYKHKYDHVQGKCPTCGIVLKQSSLLKHIKRHNKTYTACDVCGKDINAESLKSHMENVHRDKSYKCQHCDAVYKQKQSLREHEQNEHASEAEFACGTCVKKFYRKVNLRRHIEQAHLKQKPYQCEVCNMGFYTASLRSQHMRSHTDGTPYRCEICEVTFETKATLDDHLKVKHDIEEDPMVECNECGEKFETKAWLDVHRKVH